MNGGQLRATNDMMTNIISQAGPGGGWVGRENGRAGGGNSRKERSPWRHTHRPPLARRPSSPSNRSHRNTPLPVPNIPSTLGRSYSQSASRHQYHHRLARQELLLAVPWFSGSVRLHGVGIAFRPSGFSSQARRRHHTRSIESWWEGPPWGLELLRQHSASARRRRRCCSNAAHLKALLSVLGNSTQATLDHSVLASHTIQALLYIC